MRARIFSLPSLVFAENGMMSDVAAPVLSALRIMCNCFATAERESLSIFVATIA
jgi:hypothetical protein